MPTPTIGQTIAALLFDIGAITLRLQPPFRYRSGLWSPIYTDNRLLCSYPPARHAVINAFVQLIREADLQPDVLAGVATAGIPHAAWIAHELKLPMVYVRSEAKDHGKGHRIEGTLMPRGFIHHHPPHTLVIEDLITTGGGALSTVEAVRAEGGLVSHCLAICTYELPEAQQAFEAAFVTLHPLCTFTDILLTAESRRLLSPQDLKLASTWQADPVSWSRHYEATAHASHTNAHS